MQPADDEYWRRPPPPGDATGASGSDRVHYWGPPPTVPPPMEWRPPHVVEPPAPRPLPVQDHLGLDAEEARAQTVTQVLGVVAGLTMLVLLCVLCGRALF